MYSGRSSNFSCLLRNCVPLSAIFQAKQVHAQVFIHGFLSHTTLQTDLVFVYSRCSHLPDARKVFDQMSDRTMHSWNILIASYVHNSMYDDALSVFDEFRKVGVKADHYTMPQLFKVSAGTGNAYLGKMLHSWVIKLGLEGYIVVNSSVLDFYAKCGIVTDAKRVFSNMQCKDSIAWNSMIAGLGRAGLYEAALNCFTEMIGEGVPIDSMTLSSVLNASAGYGDLMKGKEVYGQVIKSILFDSDVAISNSLIDMYAKCGFLKGCENIFFSMKCSNLVTWTTMISCYAIHGKGEKSLTLFEKMKESGFKPNCVTLTAILASCSHSGLVNQGWKIFKSIKSDYAIEPVIEHYACMVDLFGRFGYLSEALGLIKSMNFVPTASVWGALLSGCTMHKNVEIGEIAAQKLFELEPENSSNFAALCHLYNSIGLYGGVSKIRRQMRKLGVAKIPGWSCINITGSVHRFYQGDCSNHQALGVSETLDRIIKASIFPSVWRLGNSR